MRKYGMIFASVIFTLAIMLIPNQNVKAEESDIQVFDYNSWGEHHFGGITEELETLKSYLDSLGSDYYYLIYASSTSIYNTIEIKVFKNKNKYGTMLNPKIYYNLSKENISLSFLPGVEYSYSLSSYFRASENNFETNFQKLKENIENNNFNNNKNTSFGGSSSFDYFFTTSKYLVYATNVENFYLNETSVYSLNIDNFIYQPSEQLPTYYEYKYSKKIDISSTFACDLNNKDMELVTIDFSDYQNENYTYQYGIKRQSNNDYISWYEISDLNNYIYNYNEYYNGTVVYARVLDSNDNEVVVNEYRINNDELPKFDLIISSSLACPIPNYDDDPQAEIINIDFLNVYFENYKYYYSYDSKTKYEFNVTSDNLVQQITEYLYNFIYFYIYDENDNLIYYTYNEVSSSDRLGYLPDNYEERHKIIFNTNPSCDLQGNEIINLKFDFSNITKYVNHYNFDVVINDKHLGAIQYYEIVLDDLNYLDNLNYEVKIYIDDYLYTGRNFSVGSNSSSFDDIYNDILNDLSSSDINDNESLFNLFVNSLNHFKDVITDILNDCTYFFNNLDSTLKYFYIAVFILILFGFLIRFIL